MVKKNEIKRVARNMADAINAERVILFGSYARGDATEHSDMDIVVYTPQEIGKGKKIKVSFVSNVLKEGRTLYVRRNRNQQAMDSETREAASRVKSWLQNTIPEAFK